ncbi:MAG TPA: hypothetical protein VGA06_00700 [Candidatus Paceibacterota bacterium]|jgi:hypothetical protein
MEQDIQKKLEDQDVKLDAIFRSVEKTRKYFLIIMWITVILVVLPVVGLVFAIPTFINTYSSLNGLL